MEASRMTAPLIYVVGASGSGKDSLIQYCRERLNGNAPVQFAHRYITRAAHAGGENHIHLSQQEFSARVQAGLFALHWASNDNQYGIGIEIDHWLEKGIAVVVNGSREYLPEVRNRYPELLAVWIDVSHEVLRQRLLARGRESEEAIEARLARHQRMTKPDGDGIIISNDGTLANAGEALIAVIHQALTCA
jgi:ribose 1,5-bisphosphokinase